MIRLDGVLACFNVMTHPMQFYQIQERPNHLDPRWAVLTAGKVKQKAGNATKHSFVSA